MSGAQQDAFLPDVFVVTTQLGKPTGVVYVNGVAIDGVLSVGVKSKPGDAARVTIALEVDVVRYGTKRPSRVKAPAGSTE